MKENITSDFENHFCWWVGVRDKEEVTNIFAVERF